MTTENSIAEIPDNNGIGTSKLTEIYLQVYEKVNARREETQKSYNHNIVVSFNDLKELHNKTIQTIHALTPDTNSPVGIKITVTHNGGESDKFSSFESFEKHNSTSPQSYIINNYGL